MLRIELFKEAVTKLNDPDIQIEEAVEYLYSHEYVDNDFLEYFGGSPKGYGGKEYINMLNAVLELNKQAMYKLSSEYFVLISPFIFYHPLFDDIQEAVFKLRIEPDFIDLLRVLADIYPHSRAYAQMGGHHSFFPTDMGPIYDKLINLREQFGLSIYDIVTYCFHQTYAGMSKKFFDMWYDYVVDAKQFGLDLMPENLLHAVNVLREKQGKEPYIYKLTEFSGNAFSISRRGKLIVIVAAIPVDTEKHQPDLSNFKLWYDDPEAVQISPIGDVSIDTRGSGPALGKLFHEIDIKLNVNTLVMVDREDVELKMSPYTGTPESTLHVDLHIGTTWVPYYEGPSRITLRPEALIEIRKNAKITQQEAANAIHVSARTFQNWESGKGSPSWSSLIKLMYLFDFTDVRRFVERKYFFDSMDESFKSGRSLSEIFPRHYNGLEPTEKSNKEGEEE